MRVKILINALSALQGGGQTYILNLLDDVAKENIHIILLVSEKNKHVFSHISGIEFLVLDSWGKSVLKRTLWETFVLPNYLKRNKIAVLFSPGGIIPLGLFKNKNVKLVTTCQNMLPFLPEQIKKAETFSLKIKFIILFFVQSFSFKKSDLVIFLSQYAQSLISKKISLKAQSVIIPHGLSKLFWEEKKKIDKDYVLYVSSFFNYKSQAVLIEAWHQLKKKYPTFTPKLLLIGDCSTEYGKAVQDQVKKYDLENEVVFLGIIPYETIASYTQSSKLNIFASTCENCPNILLEYMASKKPILCSLWEPMPEFAEDTVIYFNPEVVSDVFAKLENALLKNTYNLEELAVASYQLSKKYDWRITRKKTWKAILNFF